MFKKIYGALFFVLCMANVAYASVVGDYIDMLKQDVKQTYDEGRFSLMVPLRVWHNRLTYDDEHIDKYNEEPWGIGGGLYRWDGNDWHGLYAVAFKDSNDYLETMFGYMFLRNISVDCEDNWRLGYGYTLGLTQRHEYSYIPVPLPLPVAALTYKRFSLNATYVPGVKNDGNVLFSWLRYDF